jgi:hypothetical protein
LLRLKQEIAVVSKITINRTYQYTRGIPIYFQDTFSSHIMDSIVATIISRFKIRSEIGKQKYGTDLDRTDLSVLDWINHAQEEHMDAILYLEKLRQTLVGKK